MGLRSTLRRVATSAARVLTGRTATPSRSELRGVAARNQAMRLRARYDAAQTNADNANHWAAADDLSARAANSVPVRRLLRRRARYERANNCYAAGMLLTLSQDIVGSGPRLQMATKDPARNSLIESEFKAWARDCRLAAKLRTMGVAKSGDGETAARITSNPTHESPVWLDFEPFECDMLHTPTLVPTPNHIDGIWFDEYGQPEAYDVLDRHPGDNDVGAYNWEPRKIPARSIIHWFREDRPGQKRGIPEITPALPLFAMLRRYTLAVLAAAETAADFAAVLSSTAPGDSEDQVTPFEEIDIVQRMMLTLPSNTTLTQFRAEQPTTTYGEFKQQILNEIARCLNMPRNIALGDSSGYNYSSGRLDHQIYFKSIAITQGQCEDVVLDKLFKQWYHEATLLGICQPIDLRLRQWSWSWDPAEDIDPSKSASARMTQLQSGQLSFPRMFAELGLDGQTEMAQQAEFLGITVSDLQKLYIQQIFGAKAEQGQQGQPGQDESSASPASLENDRMAGLLAIRGAAR